MKMKKSKEESTSSETRKKKGPATSGGRLTGMLESMQKRSSPVNAHKVATKYFDDFKKERQIPEGQPKDSNITAVDTGVSTAVITAVGSTVKESKKKVSGRKDSGNKSYAEDPLLSRSENSVYASMYEECQRRKSDTHRFGLKELKERTGLSDKTIRVAIHNLEQKMNIKVEEPSLGIYGRKFRVLSREETIKQREAEGIKIDPTTKKVIEKTTAVGSTVNRAVDTAVTTIVTTAVNKGTSKKKRK